MLKGVAVVARRDCTKFKVVVVVARRDTADAKKILIIDNMLRYIVCHINFL